MLFYHVIDQLIDSWTGDAVKLGEVRMIAQVPPLIDNQTFLLRDAVREYAKYAAEVKIATGYLRVSGFNIIKDELRGLRLPALVNGKLDSPFKIIMGQEVDVPTANQLIEGYKKRVQEDVGKLDLEKLSMLYEFIQSGALDVHIQPDKRFHAKAYIFRKMSGYFRPDVTIVGSSNFTYEGQTENIELNEVDLTGFTVDYLERWFDKQWEASSEFREDLLKIIESDHRFPHLVATRLPYVYLSPADFFKHLIIAQGKEYLISGEEEKILLQFQVADYKQSLTIIKNYGGVINASAVGLGKSFVACQIIRHYLDQGKRALLIAPPHLLVEDQWKDYLQRFGISEHQITLLSMYELSADDFDYRKYLDYDLIIVDEVHNFRNHESQRYQNLRKVRTKNTEFVLLSATPINNSPEDLRNIIDIFIDETRFGASRKDLLDPYYGLVKYIRASKKVRKNEKISKALLKELQESVRKLRDRLIVRTTRKDLRNSYGEAMKLEGRIVKFYEPKLVPLRYTLSGPHYRELFSRIIGFLDELELAHLTFLNPRASDPLTALYKHLLYKRLESSIFAFYASIENLKVSQTRFLHLLRTHTLKELREKPPEELRNELRRISEDDRKLGDFIEEGRLPSEAEKQKYVRSLERDIELTNNFSAIVEKLRTAEYRFQDDKLDLLRTKLREDGRKKIIFTQFIDTAEYLCDNLGIAKEFGNVVIVTGDVKDKQSRIEGFRSDKNSKLLVSTDVLSEGVNIPEPDVVVNYDLPWNPVKLIQRVGRVDRLGVNKQIEAWNFNPDENIDREIELIRRLRTKINDIILIIGTEYAILSPEEIELIRTKERDDVELLEQKRRLIIEAKWDELEESGEKKQLDEFDQLLLTAIGKYGITLKALGSYLQIPSKKVPFTRLSSSKQGFYFFERLRVGKRHDAIEQDVRFPFPPEREQHPELSAITFEERPGRLSVAERLAVETFTHDMEGRKMKLLEERQTNIGAQRDLQGVKDSIVTKLSNVVRMRALTEQSKQRAQKIENLLREFIERDIPSSYLRKLQDFRRERLANGKRVLTDQFVEAFAALVGELKRTAQPIARLEEASLDMQGFIALASG